MKSKALNSAMQVGQLAWPIKRLPRPQHHNQPIKAILRHKKLIPKMFKEIVLRFDVPLMFGGKTVFVKVMAKQAKTAQSTK